MGMKCRDCVFWKTTKEQCRKNPPVLTGTSEYGVTSWPSTLPDDWCSKYRNRSTYMIGREYELDD